jgi:hypothetical protein
MMSARRSSGGRSFHLRAYYEHERGNKSKAKARITYDPMDGGHQQKKRLTMSGKAV